MKVIIAGSRTITNPQLLTQAIKESYFEITEIVSGGAKGVDSLGEIYAIKNNIPLKLFQADWNNLGRSAGMQRNRQMAQYADALIALWDMESKGTQNMIQTATSNKLKVYVFYVRKSE